LEATPVLAESQADSGRGHRVRSAGWCAQMRRFSDEQDTLNRNLALSGDAGVSGVAGSARSRLKGAGEVRAPTARALQVESDTTSASGQATRNVEQPISEAFGSQRCASPVRQSLCSTPAGPVPVEDPMPATPRSRQALERQVPHPSVLATANAASSTRAWPRWRASRYAMSVSSWSVDEDLKAISVDVGEGKLGTGVRLLAAADGSCALRPASEIQAGQLTDVGAISVPTVLANRGNPCSCRRFEDCDAHLRSELEPHRDRSPWCAARLRKSCVAPAESARARIDRFCSDAGFGNWPARRPARQMWSAGCAMPHSLAAASPPKLRRCWSR